VRGHPGTGADLTDFISDRGHNHIVITSCREVLNGIGDA
jgi:hypothetical protein